MGIIPPMISVVVEAMVMPLAVRVDSRRSAMGGDMNKNHQKYNLFGLSSMGCQLERNLFWPNLLRLLGTGQNGLTKDLL